MANSYTIESLLVGKTYYSNSERWGSEIRHAQKDNRAVWYGENYEPYLVELANGKWRTVAVKVSDN